MVADAARLSMQMRWLVTQRMSARAFAPGRDVAGNSMIRKCFANSIDRIRENFATIS
jgi:hypothetical protein